MSFPLWLLIIGGMMIFMALSGSLLKRLPLSAAMLYLAAGYLVATPGWLSAWSMPNLPGFTLVLERVTEVALLISLFSVGLKLGLPLWGRQWKLPLRLALLSMAVTICLIAATAHFVLGFPLGVALILGGILAPTDPVLASDVQVDHPGDRDGLRFGLTGEGALNDGAAFPFVILGLGLVGLDDTVGITWKWLGVDVVWSLCGGLLIGTLLGTLISKLVLYLRTYHNEAVGLDEFVGLGLVALAYGMAQLVDASGFLAVFSAGLALQRVKKTPIKQEPAIHPELSELVDKETKTAVATHPELAAPYMTQTVRRFNEQLERIAELLIVLVVGTLLPYTQFDWPTVAFVTFVLLIVRPLSVWVGLLGLQVRTDERWLISWFGIRGIGSIYYVMFAINRGVSETWSQPLLALTLATVAVSVVVHGISVTPLMDFYQRQRSRRG